MLYPGPTTGNAFTTHSSSPHFSSRGNLRSSPRTMAEQRREQIERNSSCFFRLNAAGDCVGSANRACNADLETIAPLALERESLRRSTATRDIPRPFESEAALRKRHASTLGKQTRCSVLVLLRDSSRFFFLQKQKS